MPFWFRRPQREAPGQDRRSGSARRLARAQKYASALRSAGLRSVSALRSVSEEYALRVSVPRRSSGEKENKTPRSGRAWRLAVYRCSNGSSSKGSPHFRRSGLSRRTQVVIIVIGPASGNSTRVLNRTKGISANLTRWFSICPAALSGCLPGARGIAQRSSHR
jgi:hypothetical protein